MQGRARADVRMAALVAARRSKEGGLARCEDAAVFRGHLSLRQQRHSRSSLGRQVHCRLCVTSSAELTENRDGDPSGGCLPCAANPADGRRLGLRARLGGVVGGKARTAGNENLAGARRLIVTLVVPNLTWGSVTIRSTTKPLTLAHHMLANTRTLIRSLKNQTLDKRYSRIEVVNRDPTTGGARDGDRGSFSVIFRAFDDVTQQHVAIKFFDPSQQGWGMDYRMMLFSREADILQRLQGNLAACSLFSRYRRWPSRWMMKMATAWRLLVDTL